MFKIKINDKEYKVYFHHERKIVQKIKNLRKFAAGADPIIDRQTVPFASTCFIKDGDQVVATGKAICSDEDMFRYTKGRKDSLSKAIEAAGFDRAQRMSVWASLNPVQRKTLGLDN